MKVPKKGCNYSRSAIKSAVNMALIFKKAQSSWKLPSLIFLLVIFICICAAIFSHLESEHDKNLYREYQKKKLDFLKKYNISEEELHSLMNELTYMKKKGFHSSYKNFWGFYHSFWFTITIITTMGFGNIVPDTFGGRLFCIVCGLLGIPLNLLVLKNVGQIISKLITDMICKIEDRLFQRKEPKHKNIKCASVSFSLMVLVILIGGGLDTIFDGWTFFDGVYFNFIALSTIGFGDLFPRVETATKLDRLGANGKRLFVTSLMMVYMIIGLSITSTVILTILNAIEEVSHIKVKWIRNPQIHSMASEQKSTSGTFNPDGQRSTPVFQDPFISNDNKLENKS